MKSPMAFRYNPKSLAPLSWAAAFFLTSLTCVGVAGQTSSNHATVVKIAPDNGNYTVLAEGLTVPVLQAQIAADIDGIWVRSAAYPQHQIKESTAEGNNGDGKEWDVTFSGLAGQPELRYHLRENLTGGFCEIQAAVRNTTQKLIHVSAIRPLETLSESTLSLGGLASRDRVLSDSFSEDTPAIRIRDLADADAHLHLGVGSQLIFNRDSGWSFFAGAATSDRFLTLLRLSLSTNSAQATSFSAESTGTTEITRNNSLAESPSADRIPLSLEVAPGAEITSEGLFFSIDSDYHRQLETYGRLIRDLHHARVEAPVAMGWWSWTAFYYGLNEGAAQTNAQFLAQNLRPLGFNFFHLDEGYQYARGEYTTPDATQFPHGMIAFEDQVRSLGLTPGLWTAPFEVSERASIFINHKDWLVHNKSGEPIHLGWANNHLDRLYALDTTNPEAQHYLRSTYAALVHEWGIRYIKLDFMDDSAVEGVRYQRNTSAMEAQRIGLDIIRQSVGNEVLLDKDGSAMLNPVGIVDYGRIAQDTGHTFSATREAAPAVAARYYMNRNFFVNDPDAFTASTQTVKDHPWNGGQVPLTLEEAKVSIALSAISGGMFEIGDDLPTLGSHAERLALVKNPTLLRMVKLGKASTPVDLMTYVSLDEQPSIFLLKESPAQSVLTIFNWTNGNRSHSLSLASLGLSRSNYTVREIFDANATARIFRNALSTSQPAHSVRMFLLTNISIQKQSPNVILDKPDHVKTGEAANFIAHVEAASFPVSQVHWFFGDVSLYGLSVTHTYTRPGTYHVRVEAVGTLGLKSLHAFDVTVEGTMSSVFAPANKTRFRDQQPQGTENRQQ